MGELEKEENLGAFGCFYESNNLEGVSKYTIIVELLRKLIVIAIVVMLDDNFALQCVTIIGGSVIMALWYILVLPRKSLIAQFGVILTELITMISGIALASFRPNLSLDQVESRMSILVSTFAAIPLCSAFTAVVEQIWCVTSKFLNYCRGRTIISTTSS
jgi:ABC-type uncharacterized transport system permease subunit